MVRHVENLLHFSPLKLEQNLLAQLFSLEIIHSQCHQKTIALKSEQIKAILNK